MGSSVASAARGRAGGSTASFAAGVVTLGVGTYLVLSAGDGSSAPRVGVTAAPGGMAVRGLF